VKSLIIVLSNEFQEFYGRGITIHDALSSKFSYDDLMTA